MTPERRKMMKKLRLLPVHAHVVVTVGVVMYL
jgi:hypothetical protein